MAEINFLNIFHGTEDKQVLRNYVDEITDLYGFSCRLKRWNGIQTVLDPMYQDSPTIYDNDEDLYDVMYTHVYVDYQRFNEIIKSYGHAMEMETSINGLMKFDDHPEEDDIIEIKDKYDDVYYKFKLGSTDIHKDICYSVVLNIYHTDSGYKDDKPKNIMDQT